jgi:hypothetical protein
VVAQTGADLDISHVGPGSAGEAQITGLPVSAAESGGGCGEPARIWRGGLASWGPPKLPPCGAGGAEGKRFRLFRIGTLRPEWTCGMVAGPEARGDCLMTTRTPVSSLDGGGSVAGYCAGLSAAADEPRSSAWRRPAGGTAVDRAAGRQAAGARTAARPTGGACGSFPGSATRPRPNAACASSSSRPGRCVLPPRPRSAGKPPATPPVVPPNAGRTNASAAAQR